MTLYELLLFIHVVATITWIGSGFLNLVLALIWVRERDEPPVMRILKDQEWLGQRVFIPSSLVVVAMGIALVIESEAWSFDQLWIVLGLLGFAATFVTGLFFLKPIGDRIGADMEREGGRLTPKLYTDARRLLVMARLDYVVLVLVVFDMVVKPTGDDVAVLIAMALVALAGFGFVFSRLRALDAEAATAPSAA